MAAASRTSIEAMRWVMGESSLQGDCAPRAWTTSSSAAPPLARPATPAEVVLVVDNADHAAPAVFNDADMLEISAASSAGRVRYLPHQQAQCAP